MDKDMRDTFWKAFQISPFIMMKLEGAHGHAEHARYARYRIGEQRIGAAIPADYRPGGAGPASRGAVSRPTSAQLPSWTERAP